MRAIIQFDDGHNGKVGATEHEVRDQLLETPTDGHSFRMILRDIDELRERHLNKNLIIRISSVRTLVGVLPVNS